MRALDGETERSLSVIGQADILIGIPSYNCAKTIGRVISQSANGLAEYFGNRKSIILVSDGGSTDATLETAMRIRLPEGVKLMTCLYQGVPGKGSAVKALFEAAFHLGVSGLAMIDSDVESITPSWIRLLIDPVLHEVGLVTPRYIRHKYDGTITNQLCYPLTRALYGKRIRQPIGGDFGLSQELASKLLQSPLWQTPYIPRFGIDIFITASAIAKGFVVEEADLGAKIHGAKDPSSQLGSMFREVAGSALACMDAYAEFWREIKGSVPVLLRTNHVEKIEPRPVNVSLHGLVEEFRSAYPNSGCFREAISPDLRRELDDHASAKTENLIVPLDVWAKTVYETSAAFRRSNESQRNRLLEGLRAVWTGRVATFVRETAMMTNREAEAKVEEEAEYFENTKNDLLAIY